ncbi:hypothetical protein ACKVWC_007194 [Pyricularia oryzae]
MRFSSVFALSALIQAAVSAPIPSGTGTGNAVNAITDAATDSTPLKVATGVTATGGALYGLTGQGLASGVANGQAAMEAGEKTQAIGEEIGSRETQLAGLKDKQAGRKVATKGQTATNLNPVKGVQVWKEGGDVRRKAEGNLENAENDKAGIPRPGASGCKRSLGSACNNPALASGSSGNPSAAAAAAAAAAKNGQNAAPAQQPAAALAQKPAAAAALAQKPAAAAALAQKPAAAAANKIPPVRSGPVKPAGKGRV